MAEYVATKHKNIVEACHNALNNDVGQLARAEKRVDESLLELESSCIMSATHKFVGSSSSIRFVGARSVHFVALCSFCATPTTCLSILMPVGTLAALWTRLRKMQTNHIELVTLKYASDPILHLMHRVSCGQDVDVATATEGAQ